MPTPPMLETPDLTFWAQGVGAWGKINGDGNAAFRAVEKKQLQGLLATSQARTLPSKSAPRRVMSIDYAKRRSNLRRCR